MDTSCKDTLINVPNHIEIKNLTQKGEIKDVVL